MFKRLARLANKLDELGHSEAADKVDNILREAGLGDWLKEKLDPVAWGKRQIQKVCSCLCSNCKKAKGTEGTTVQKLHCKNKETGCQA